jgi:hypothetical protein
MGDPGTTESFEFPKYAYIILMKQTGVDSWELWRKEELVLLEENWIPMRYYYGTLRNPGDSIYKYKNTIQFFLNNETPKGRVYAICSKKKLNFNRSIGSISNLSDLLNMTFNTTPDSIQQSLQDIYSTPYNYNVDGQYYCSFNCEAGNTSSVDLIMYHVAAKVDITWKVDETVRIKPNPADAVRLTYMDARFLFNGDAYCFKPMENEVASKPTAGRTVHIVTPSDEGLWWEGRSYFYTIPYTVDANPGYFPLQMLMRTNGSTSDNYCPTLNLEINTSSPFVPWLRANFNISAPLISDAPTKWINN